MTKDHKIVSSFDSNTISRRQFLGYTALAVTGVLVAPEVFAKVQAQPAAKSAAKSSSPAPAGKSSPGAGAKPNVQASAKMAAKSNVASAKPSGAGAAKAGANSKIASAKSSASGAGKSNVAGLNRGVVRADLDPRHKSKLLVKGRFQAQPKGLPQKPSFKFSQPPLEDLPEAPSIHLARDFGERRLSFYNCNTGEHLNSVYWAEGSYLKTSLGEIDHLLRDHNTGEETSIDQSLLDILYMLQQRIGSNRPYEVLCGYRSAVTNALMAERSGAVARHSMHLEGRAIDIRLPSTSLSSLRLAAMSLRQGGVGYYPRSNFVHVDSGDVRYW